MSLASEHSLRQTANVDVVGDRDKLIFVGMAAVFAACVAFGAARLVLALNAGALTPWWANLGGAAAMLTLYLWYRRRPGERSAEAAHGTALVATLALLVPVVYGMGSTIWWLGLVGFAMVLLGRRREAWVWGLVIPLVITGAVLVEPSVQLEGAAGETRLESGMAKIAFALVLVSMAAAFRGVAERRARELHDSEERHRNLFDRAPVGIVHYDKGMHITDCNGRFAGILGSDRERLVGLDLRLLGDKRVLPALQVALSGGQGEYDGPFDSGTTRTGIFLSIRTAPLHGEDSHVVGAIGILEDVTASRRADGRAAAFAERAGRPRAGAHRGAPSAQPQSGEERGALPADRREHRRRDLDARSCHRALHVRQPFDPEADGLHARGDSWRARSRRA